jgi:hypothetical protein
MSTLNAESVLNLINQLPATEQARLRQLLEEQPLPATVNGALAKPPLDKRLPNRPAHDSSGELRWLAEHRREYANQWVALEGDHLIAASPNHETVFAAVDAAGVKLPFITFIEDPDHPIQLIWK